MTIALYKAAPFCDRSAPDLQLIATEPIPDGPNHRDFPDMRAWEEAVRASYDKQARIIVDALIGSLPGGTIDAVLCELMAHRRCILRVPFTGAAP